MDILSIHLSAFVQEEPQRIDILDDHTDVIVRLKSGETYASSFFSYQNVATLTAANRLSGDCLSGTFFWKNNMLLVEDIGKNTVERVVRFLIDEGDFTTIFKKL